MQMGLLAQVRELNQEALEDFARRVRPDGVFFGGKVNGLAAGEWTFAVEEDLSGNLSLRHIGFYHSMRSPPPGGLAIPGIDWSQVSHNSTSGDSTTGIGASVDVIPGWLSGYVNTQGDLHSRNDGRLGTINLGIVVNPDKILADGLIAAGAWTGGLSAAVGAAIKAAPAGLYMGVNYNVGIYLNDDGSLRFESKGEVLPGFERISVPEGSTVHRTVDEILSRQRSVDQSAQESMRVMVSAAAIGQRDPGINPWVIAEAANANDINHVPALFLAAKIRDAIVDIGPEYAGQLTDYAQRIVDQGGPRTNDEAAYVLDELWHVADANHRKLLGWRVSNDYRMDFDLDWLRDANKEHVQRNSAGQPSRQQILEVRQYFAPIEFEELFVPRGNMKGAKQEAGKDSISDSGPSETITDQVTTVAAFVADGNSGVDQKASPTNAALYRFPSSVNMDAVIDMLTSA
jgi:hypothetical protein